MTTSIVLVALASLALVLYVAGVYRERTRAQWSAWRAASFVIGIVLLLVALVPQVAEWAHRDLRGHMVQHLLLGMFAPLALVLGAPGTVLLRNLRPATARRVVAFLGVRPLRFLLHPATAAVLDMGGMYVLYLTPLYAFSLADPTTHAFLHVHFLVSGVLFSWSIAGPDPAPHRPGVRVRLAIVFVATAAHAILGKLMFAYGYPRGTTADLAEIQSAAQWMYYGGDLAELLLIAVLVQAWFRRRKDLPGMLAADLRARGVIPAGSR